MKTAKLAAGLLLTVAALTARAGSFTATDSTFLTFDNSSGTVALSPVFPGGSVIDVDITVNFAKCNDPAMGPSDSSCPVGGEEFSSEIFFFLVAPDGTRVDLVYTGTFPSAQNVGGRYDIRFDDEAGSAVGPVMVSGSFRPEELLSGFDHAMPAGSWILHMGDSVGQDPLSYFSACLQVTTANGTNGVAGCAGIQQVPEPGSLPVTLLGFALIGGLETLRRRAVPRRST